MAWMWLIVLILIVAAVIVKLRRSSHIFIIRQTPVRRPDDPPLRHSLSPDRSGEVEQMVCCEYCEVYVPASEVIEHSGKLFCCREHSVAYFMRTRSS